MRTNQVRAWILIWLLVFYPLLGYVSVNWLEREADTILGAISFLLLLEMILSKFHGREKIRLPFYVLFLGIFFLYQFLSDLFLAEDAVLYSSWMKYLYSQEFFRLFVLLIVLENTDFSMGQLRLAMHALFFMLLLASVVSVIQVSNPLFLVNKTLVFEGDVTFNRFKYYYLERDQLDLTGEISRLVEGYRLSVYSWINERSVGIDFIAIFSLLWGWKGQPVWRRALLFLSGALVSFLASARWIMLNFLVVSAQLMLRQKEPILKVSRYVVYLMATVLLVGYVFIWLGIDLKGFVEGRLLSDSALTRIYAFEVFAEVFPQAPVFGTGGVDTPEMLRLIKGRTSQIHVGWLKLFYYYGLVGGLLYLAFIGALLRQLWGRAQLSGYWGSFFAFLAFILANFLLYEPSIFFHGLLLAVIFSKEREIHKPLGFAGAYPAPSSDERMHRNGQPIDT